MKAQLPIIHHGSGRAGGMIFQTYWGRTYLRAMPVLFHYPDTEAQQKVQGLYYNIVNQFRAVYSNLRKTFPQLRRGNKNIYNVLSKGIFQAAQPFDSLHTAQPPLRFGIDTQQQIQLSFPEHKMEVTKTQIIIAFRVEVKLWRRTFRPKTLNLIIVNQTQQSVIGASATWQSPVFEIILSNTVLWQPTDSILVYASATNREAMSNFYLMQQSRPDDKTSTI